VRSAALWLAVTLAGGCGPPAPGDAAPLVLPPFTVRGRWTDPTRLRVLVQPAGGPVPEEVFRAAVERALAVWARTGLVGFRTGPGEPDIVFAWDGESFGRDTSVASTGAVGPGCTVRFDAGRRWREGGGDGPSLFQAAVHELGHALGLGHTEDPAAVLHPQRENGRTSPGPADLAGLASLYGGGVDGPGDLFVEGGPALRRVAPPGRADWTLFDTDGDGDDELVVWEVAGEGSGALTAYHFARGPLLERTVGPVLGAAGHGARVQLRREGAERALLVEWPDGTRVRRVFDDAGLAAEPRPVAAAAAVPASGRRSAGDLDGDGRPERVTERR